VRARVCAVSLETTGDGETCDPVVPAATQLRVNYNIVNRNFNNNCYLLGTNVVIIQPESVLTISFFFFYVNLRVTSKVTVFLAEVKNELFSLIPSEETNPLEIPIQLCRYNCTNYLSYYTSHTRVK